MIRKAWGCHLWMTLRLQKQTVKTKAEVGTARLSAEGVCLNTHKTPQQRLILWLQEFQEISVQLLADH